MAIFLNTITTTARRIPNLFGGRLLNRGRQEHVGKSVATVEERKTKKTRKPLIATATRTRADMGQVQAPEFRQVVDKVDHMVNAFNEFVAITQATRTININRCVDILKSFKLQNEGLLKVRLDAEDATIYNNDTSQVIKGTKIVKHMAAYSATAGIVPLDEDETKRSGKITFRTPENDPIVVTTQGTEIWLEDAILERANSLKEDNPIENWVVPEITWVTGVPGSGKTTWIINNINPISDIVVTTTTEAKNELKEQISGRAGADAARRIRTLASILVNGVREQDRTQCSRLIVDEALMNHFGSIAMITRITGARALLLIGDINQLPYIDRDNLFKMNYLRPNHLANINQELLCTHRCPMDVAYALREIYNGIYSSRKNLRSLYQTVAGVTEIPPTQPNTLFLTFTQAEKTTLLERGYGKGEGSKTLTIHEAQGLSSETVIICKMTSKRLKIHDSVSHAVVAISRHTKKCIYYTNDNHGVDAVGRFIQLATKTPARDILDHNLKMAIWCRDEAVVESLVNLHHDPD